jgi:hypothetical protein
LEEAFRQKYVERIGSGLFIERPEPLGLRKGQRDPGMILKLPSDAIEQSSLRHGCSTSRVPARATSTRRGILREVAQNSKKRPSAALCRDTQLFARGARRSRRMWRA